MDAKTLEALKQSIEHWKLLADGKGDPVFNSIFGDHCPLCAMFHDEEEDDEYFCAGCPVFERTEESQCHGTPWYGVHDRLSIGYDSVEFKAAAKKQLEFLESLLPKEQP